MNGVLPITGTGLLLYLPEGVGPEQLATNWQLETGRSKSQQLTFWDSFEWGIWFSGHLLYSCDEQYALCSRNSGWPAVTCCLEQAAGRRQFWHDFSSPDLRQMLREMLGLRGLAAVAKGRFSQQQSLLRNGLDKIVCRVTWLTVSTTSKETAELVSACQVVSLLGYEAEAQELVTQLTGLGATPDGIGPVELLLRHDGRQPRRYSLRPCFDLQPETPARLALNRIVRNMLLLAEENLPGIIEDRDTEFLHDYRICLRKIRSLLSLIRDAYPAEEIGAIRNRLGDEARRTNRLRDLDVYLLAREEYLALLPPVLRPALHGLFDDFGRERRHELKRVIAHLRLPAHRRLLRELGEFFSDQAIHPPTEVADLPVGPLVFRAIFKRYRKIRRLAQGVAIDTPDATLHQLRIECKKLRYLLEFFSELIPTSDYETILKLLRRLQGRLGDFNDGSVQQQALLEYRHQTDRLDDATVLSLGGLVTALYQLQQQARSKIGQSLDEFSSMTTEAQMKRIFKPARKGRP